MTTDGQARPFRFAILVPTLVALVASLLMHAAIPVAALVIPVKKAQSRAQIDLITVPPQDNPLDPETPPDNDTKKAEEKKSKSPKVDKKTPKKAPKKVPKKKTAKETTKEQKKTNKVDDRTTLPPKATAKKNGGGRIVKATPADLARMMRARLRAAREAKRAAKAAKRAEARAKRQDAIDAERAVSGVGGIPPGDPRALFACEATQRGKQIHLRAERAVRDWVTVLPTLLMPFQTRPALGDYVDQTTQIVKRGRTGVRRVGSVEMALPQSVLQLPLELPKNARLAVGHLDGRCLVGFSYTRGAKDLFPITLSRIPVRMLIGAKSSKALVDIILNRDASFTLRLHDKVDRKDAGKILFALGRLKNGNAIAATIASHLAAAETFKEVAGWFGVDIKKSGQKDRRKRLKDSIKQVSTETSVSKSGSPKKRPKKDEPKRRRKRSRRR